MRRNVESDNSVVGVSVDLDSIKTHLAGYGYSDCSDLDSSYKIALPRILEIFAEFKVTATFFLTAKEAEHYPNLVKQIVAAGHEVGCHSMTHCLPLNWDEPQVRDREIREAKSLLETLSGAEVIGFRAPSWDSSRALRNGLEECGFRYDASSFPSWMMLLYRLRVKDLSKGGGAPRMSVSFSEMFSSRKIHRVGKLIEIPVSTLPLLRIPYYHTMRFVLPPIVMSLFPRFLLTGKQPVTYTFHAVDFLGLVEDGIDKRMSCHPGMKLPLTRKLNLVREALTELTSGGSVRALREIVLGGDCF